MADDAFDGQILVDKLSKLNSSQQSIESLSRWCISHRKKAKQIVESWNKLFESAQRDQRVSFLYLANDILQNSRRKGSEFVNEFWKVLPAALKTVYGAGDENGKKAASRLVNIWEERKVFGSRGQNLKDEMLGKNPPPDPTTLVSNIGKNSNPVKIVKRDANALRIKLTVGAMPEKIIMSFQSVHDQNGVEEAALNKFKGAIVRAGEIERDAEVISTQGGNLQGSPFVDEMLEQENVLQQCITQLENSEAARASLVSQLKQALQDQEPQLELLRTQLQVARGQLDQVIHLRERLTSQPMIIHSQQMDPMRAAEVNTPLPHLTTPPPPPAQAVKISSATSKTTEEENKKAAAAAVAAKLAASTSSAQMLTSVLSSLVAESMTGGSGSKSAGFSSGLSMFPPEKRAKLEKPMSVDNNSEAGGNAAYFSQMQATPFLPQAPPPPPPGAPSNSPTNQFAQSGGHMMVAMPYGYGGGSSLPPPPPMPMGLAMPAPPPQHPQSSQSQQQGSNGGGYYRPPGIGFYGQSQQPTPPPPMQRQ